MRWLVFRRRASWILNPWRIPSSPIWCECKSVQHHKTTGGCARWFLGDVRSSNFGASAVLAQPLASRSYWRWRSATTHLRIRSVKSCGVYQSAPRFHHWWHCREWSADYRQTKVKQSLRQGRWNCWAVRLQSKPDNNVSGRVENKCQQYSGQSRCPAIDKRRQCSDLKSSSAKVEGNLSRNIGRGEFSANAGHTYDLSCGGSYRWSIATNRAK